MSGQHCETYDVKRETVHCYPVNSLLLTAVARDGWNLSAVFKFCFCFVLLYNKSLNDWSLGEQSLSVYSYSCIDKLAPGVNGGEEGLPRYKLYGLQPL